MKKVLAIVVGILVTASVSGLAVFLYMKQQADQGTEADQLNRAQGTDSVSYMEPEEASASNDRNAEAAPADPSEKMTEIGSTEETETAGSAEETEAASLAEEAIPAGSDKAAAQKELSAEQVRDLLCDKYLLTEENLSYYGELDINGTPYYGYFVIDAGEGAWDSLLVYNKTTQEEGLYDVLGNLSAVSKEEFAGLNTYETIAEASNTADAPSYSGQELKLDQGRFILQGLYTGMSFDEAIHRILENNKIDADAPGHNSGEYATRQSGDRGEGDDTIPVGNQSFFGCPCVLYLNFDRDIDSASSTAVPNLEQIVCLFRQGYDTEQQIKDTCISLFGEPTKIYTDSESGIEGGFEWANENGDMLTIWYAVTHDSQLAVNQIVISSDTYIKKK